MKGEADSELWMMHFHPCQLMSYYSGRHDRYAGVSDASLCRLATIEFEFRYSWEVNIYEQVTGASDYSIVQVGILIAWISYLKVIDKFM